MGKRLLIMLRNAASGVMAARYKAKRKYTDWEPEVPTNFHDLALWGIRYMKWTEDPWRGNLDHIRPIGTMNWTLQNKGFVYGDCDDLSTYYAYMLRRMGVKRLWRVNIFSQRHVICVFEYGNTWGFTDNKVMFYPTECNSIEDCVYDMYRGAEIYYAERLL